MAAANAKLRYRRANYKLPYSNTGSAIVSKDVVVRASGTSGVIGIAEADISATTGTGVLNVDGTWELPKSTGEAFTDGQVVYWDPSATSVTGTSTTVNTRCGRAVGAAASAVTIALVDINAA